MTSSWSAPTAYTKLMYENKQIRQEIDLDAVRHHGVPVTV